MYICGFPRCQLILSWTGATLEGGQYEKANVNATDNHHSTCLHYAAAAGMKNCVEVRESVWTSEFALGFVLCLLSPPPLSVQQSCVLRVIQSAKNFQPVKSV